MDDIEAIDLLKQGDISGLETLVLKYQLRALRAAYLVTKDRATAEDVVQSAFLRVYDRAGQFKHEFPFGPWFLRIVVNDALKTLRKGDRLFSLSNSPSGSKISFADLLPDLGPGLSENIERAETQHTVWEAVEKLSASQRAVVVLKYYLDLTDSQIAERRGTHSGTVKVLLHRARQRLKLLLGPADIT